jgi:2-phosphosulfolactate phosphatase
VTGRELALNVPTNLVFAAKDIAKAVQRKDVIIVIDVLRSCSTIVTALANGAEGVIPTKTVKEARVLHKKHPGFILAGERKGIKPKGFDLGNSPLEFSPQNVKGKHIILTTTSGTKAIISSKNAKYVFTGAFLNAETIAKTALKIAEREGIGISLISAGTNGRFSLEDFICAGAITESFPADTIEHSDAVSAALLAFQQARKSLNKVLRSGYHARYLISQGFEEDVKFCSQLNVFKIVPFLKDETIIPLNRLRLFY